MDELLGLGRRTKKERSPSRKILRRMERIETLPRTQQIAVLKTIDNALELQALKTGARWEYERKPWRASVRFVACAAPRPHAAESPDSLPAGGRPGASRLPPT